MTAHLFWQHVALVLLFGAIVGVEHWWSQRSAHQWQRRWLDELQLLKKNWGIVVPTLEALRRDVGQHTKDIAELQRRVEALEEK